MKKTVCLSFILLIYFCAFAQNKTDLVGTWYGKIRTYAFRQVGNAQCYTKRKIDGWQQLLIIDSKLNYVYTEYYQGDTIRTNGFVDLENDTLRFLAGLVNQPGSNNPFESSYPLYVLNKTELIYSKLPARKIITEDIEDKRFQKVEVAATYSLGQDEFLKAIYASLAGAGVSKKDSAKINSYQVKIDSSGKMDVATLRPVNADPEYFDAVKQGLLNLRNNFKPATQNGRAVNAYMTIQVTY